MPESHRLVELHFGQSSQSHTDCDTTGTRLDRGRRNCTPPPEVLAVGVSPDRVRIVEGSPISPGRNQVEAEPQKKPYCGSSAPECSHHRSAPNQRWTTEKPRRIRTGIRSRISPRRYPLGSTRRIDDVRGEHQHHWSSVSTRGDGEPVIRLQRASPLLSSSWQPIDPRPAPYARAKQSHPRSVPLRHGNNTATAVSKALVRAPC